MSRIYVFGTTNFSKLLHYYETEELQNEITGFTLDREYITGEEDLPATLIPFDEIPRDSDTEILIGIGYNDMNGIREKVYNKVKEAGFRIRSFIHPSAQIARNVVMGEGTIILENTVIQPFVSIGKCNIFWSNVNVAHHTTIGDFNFFGAMSSLSGDCAVTNHCFLGTNSTVRNGVVLEPRSLIGAGAYINKDTEEKGVYASKGTASRDTNSDTYRRL